MRKSIIFLACYFIFFKLWAGSEWGKADAAQFSIRVCPFDSSANAMLLVDSVYITVENREKLNDPFNNAVNAMSQYRTNFAFKYPYVVYTFYKRIQVLNKEGINNCNISIPYITLMNMEQISQLEAQTLNLNDKGKVQITKVKEDAFFYDTLVKGAATKVSFTFPDVKEGSIVEYKYTIAVLGTAIRDWAFEGELPRIRSAISLKLPDFVDYDMRFQGYLPLIRDKIEKYNDAWNSISGIKAHYAMNNIPAYKPEPFITTMNDYLNKMRFYPIPISKSSGTITKTTYHSWDEVAKTVEKTDKLSSPVKNVAWGFLAKEVTNGLTDKREVIKAIYNKVHSIIKWNKLYSFKPGVFAALNGNDSMGNSADINMVLISMLKSAGVKADPVLISTRDHGKIDTTFFNPAQFNNVVALVELDSVQVLLDAISPFDPWYILPENDLNSIGLRISETKTDASDIYKSDWVKITPSSNSLTAVTSTITIDPDGNYAAKSYFSATDYCAIPFRDRPETKTIEASVKELLKIPDDIEVKDQSYENEKDVDKKLKISFTLEKKNNSTADSFIYVTPFPLKFYSDNPLRQKDRIYPIDFAYTIQRSMHCSISIPENYKVAELPKAVNMVLSDHSASFTLIVQQNDLNIQMSSTFKINQVHYSASMFEDLKELYAKMIDACNVSLVLQKK